MLERVPHQQRAHAQVQSILGRVLPPAARASGAGSSGRSSDVRGAAAAAPPAEGTPPEAGAGGGRRQGYALAALQCLVEAARAHEDRGQPCHWGWCRCGPLAGLVNSHLQRCEASLAATCLMEQASAEPAHDERLAKLAMPCCALYAWMVLRTQQKFLTVEASPHLMQAYARPLLMHSMFLWLSSPSSSRCKYMGGLC
jgi:hypothetical protein